jgi:glycosyltransferase involved in cell wall biosynthesis
MQKYLLSIITVVKNDEKNIQKTIESVLNQKNLRYEYIIVDGNSKDKTLKKIQKYKKKIHKIISANDKGIYDAMNKGLKVAKGDIIVFCNSGDTFYKDSLKKVIKLFKKYNYDFVFGTVMRNYMKGKILKHGFSFKRLLYNFDFATSHTTGFFLKKKVYKKIGFYDTRFKCSADYDLYYRMYKGGYKGGSTNRKDIIGNVSSGGYSSKIGFFEHLIEESKIRIKNKQNFFIILLIFINAVVKNFFKKL